MRILLAIIAAFVLSAAPASAGNGRWSVLSADSTAPLQVAGIALGEEFASIHYDRDEARWIATIGLRHEGPVTKLRSRVTRWGKSDRHRVVEGEELHVTPSADGALKLVSFVLSPEDVTLFQKGTIWWVVTDETEVPVPLTGSFLALKRVKARIEDHRARLVTLTN